MKSRRYYYCYASSIPENAAYSLSADDIDLTKRKKDYYRRKSWTHKYIIRSIDHTIRLDFIGTTKTRRMRIMIIYYRIRNKCGLSKGSHAFTRLTWMSLRESRGHLSTTQKLFEIVNNTKWETSPATYSHSIRDTVHVYYKWKDSSVQRFFIKR